MEMPTMTYTTTSYTSSGWTISNDPDVEPAKQWRATHPKFGEQFFKTREEILPYTLKRMIEQVKASTNTTPIGTVEDLILVDQLVELLVMADPITQQKAIEILMARHIMAAARNAEEADLVLSGMVKHTVQILAGMVEMAKEDECQYEHPMVFCKLCGTWMNCKRDGIDTEYRRRPDDGQIVHEPTHRKPS